MDKCSRDYWEGLWHRAGQSRRVRADSRSYPHYIEHKVHRLFRRWFDEYKPGRGRLLEVGCGNSKWLAHFSEAFGFEVAGLDYSPTGCQKAQNALSATGVAGPIYLADMFAPPRELQGQFDVVVSMGVVEHFDDTANAIRALRYFLKDGGIVVTEVPNMTGLPGALQRSVGRTIYDIHVPLSREALVAAHEKAGLDVVKSVYFPGISLGVLQPTGLSNAMIRIGYRALGGTINRAAWILDRCGLGLPPSPLYAPYVFCVARKRGGTEQGALVHA